MDASFWIFVTWIVGTIVNGMIADAKNHSAGSAMAFSLLLSPVTSYLSLLAVPPIPADTSCKSGDGAVIKTGIK
jgi:hypothetical protein